MVLRLTVLCFLAYDDTKTISLFAVKHAGKTSHQQRNLFV